MHTPPALYFFPQAADLTNIQHHADTTHTSLTSNTPQPSTYLTHLTGIQHRTDATHTSLTSSTPPTPTHLTGIQRSADATHPPVRPQGNSALAAIQCSADGPPPSVRPLNPHTTKKNPSLKTPPQQKILPSILQISLTKDTVYTSNINYPPKHHTDLSLPQPTHRTDCRRGGCMVGTRCVGVSRWSY